MLYPLKFEPILLPKIWGGQRLKTLYKGTEKYENIGESWLVSGIEGKESVVMEGFFAENTLPELVEVYLNDLVGNKVYDRYGENFPLLVKIIDSADDLSIQVHPNDETAQKHHNCSGKNEMWYFLDCEEDAFIYAGFNKKITKKEYLKAVKNNNLEKYLNKIFVKKGGVVSIPAGCVHSIGRGCTILEIQQSSDITYRIYDYNRKDDKGNTRELHTEQALDAIDFKNRENNLLQPQIIDNQAKKIIENEYFKCLVLNSTAPQELDLSEIDSFVLLSVVEGSLSINYPDGKITAKEWETILVPAALDFIILEPQNKAKILITYINN